MKQPPLRSKPKSRSSKNAAKRERRTPLTAWIWRMSKIAGIAAGAVLIGMASLLLYLRAQSLPAASISQTSQMFDLQGNVIDTFHTGENRSSVPLKEISPYLVQATLAIEDKRFYDHFGFDMKGMARAAFINMENMSKKQGASTLTQQLARNLYLTHERTWSRKLKEAAYTVQLEMNYSKDQILTMYLNQIYYGHGAYGIEAAAELYFGKHASELDLAESSILAGIPKGPKYYSPYLDMKSAKDRQKIILAAMAQNGSVSRSDADHAYEELLSFKPLSSGETAGFAPYFRDYIRLVAVEQLGIDEQLLTEGGIRIYTTLDSDAQRAAEEAVAKGMPGNSEQQAALVAIDPRTGYVKAMVGGRNYKTNQYNRVFAQSRQPGSSFKPILYLTALENGMTPVSKFRSAPTVFTYDNGRQTYQPRNYNDEYTNGFIDMRQAIASSDNTFAVNTIMTIGPDKVIETARKLGINSPMKPVPSLALGTFPVSPFEMASAFGTFANGGKHVEPTAILRIENDRGQVLYEAPQAKSSQVTDPAHAYVLTSLMESVFETGGTGYRVSAMIKRPVAGKTGTTASDAWLVGYTPELVTAVWTGYDKGRILTTAEAHRAAPIFASFTEKALAAVPPKIFPVPGGVVSAYVEPGSGKLAAAGCKSRRLESFVAGTEPTETCGDPGGAANKAGESEAKDAGHSSWWADLKRWWKD